MENVQLQVVGVLVCAWVLITPLPAGVLGDYCITHRGAGTAWGL